MADKSSGLSFMQVLQSAYKYRRLLILQFLIVAAVSVTIALIIPKTFTSSATVLPPTSSSLPPILPADMSTGLGGVISSITGTPGSDTNRLISILKSRNLAEEVIRQFSLMDRYKTDTIEETIEELNKHVQYTIDEEQMVRVSVFAETEFFHPEADEEQTILLARDMCQYIVEYLDRDYTRLQTQKARYEREIIENRLEQSNRDLQQAQLALKEFSEQTGVVALPEQLEAGITAAAELESELTIREIELGVLKKTFNDSSPEVQNKARLVNQLRASLDKMLRQQSDSLGIFPNMTESPSLILQYANLQREITIQDMIHEFLIQQYEQVKLQETRQTPSLQLIDNAKLPTDKVRPIRSLLVILLVSLGMMLSLLYILIKEHYQQELRKLATEIRNDG